MTKFIAGPGTLVWGPREVPHAFTVQPNSARALVIVTPGGFEQMFADGGIPADEATETPTQRYDPEAATDLAEQYGFEVIETSTELSGPPRTRGSCTSMASGSRP